MQVNSEIQFAIVAGTLRRAVRPVSTVAGTLRRAVRPVSTVAGTLRRAVRPVSHIALYTAKAIVRANLSITTERDGYFH